MIKKKGTGDRSFFVGEKAGIKISALAHTFVTETGEQGLRQAKE